MVVLQKSYRFAQNSGIAALANRVNSGSAEEAKNLLADVRYPDVNWRVASDTAELIQQPVINHWRRVMQCSGAAEALALMSEFSLLTAVRQGPQGLVQVNALVEQLLRRSNVIASNKQDDDEFYPGQPLMVLRNDPVSGLANGDIGIIWPVAGKGLRFFYRRNGELQSLATARLPEYDTVFAMTVHKSQGSEFDQVLLLMQ